MGKETVQEILRGGYDKAYEAGAIITGGHTIQGAEPIYGLAVSGFVHPKKVLENVHLPASFQPRTEAEKVLSVTKLQKRQEIWWA